jgi:hypothetical protein
MTHRVGLAAGLVVDLSVAATAALGLPVLATLSIKNRGESPETVSSRLNLMEGDVRLQLTGPDGGARRVMGAGGQPDTASRRVTLLPGQQIIGSMNLLYTDVGVTFPEPGKYILQAEYSPSPVAGWQVSEPRTMTVLPPQSEAERGAAALLQNEDARAALTLAEADRAPAELRELAERFAGTLAGTLARLILAGSDTAAGDAALSTDIFQTTDPITMAELITSLSTPYSGVAKRLTQSYAAYINPKDTVAKAPELSDVAERERALRIIKGEPIEMIGEDI